MVINANQVNWMWRLTSDMTDMKHLDYVLYCVNVVIYTAMGSS